MLDKIIDYECEDGCRPLYATSSVTISNPDLLFSNPKTKCWKEHLLFECGQCQKAIGGIYFTNKWRAETLQPGLEFDNFKPRLQSGIFKAISWLHGLFYGGDDQGFLKDRVKTI